MTLKHKFILTLLNLVTIFSSVYDIFINHNDNNIFWFFWGIFFLYLTVKSKIK